MANMKEQKLLFQGFEPVSTEAWEQLIREDLKGADYERKLVWKTLEGIAVKPYYRSEDLLNLPLSSESEVYPLTKKAGKHGNDWLIRQDIRFQNPDETALKINRMLDRGVESVGLVLTGKETVNDLASLLTRIPLTRMEINFSGGGVKQLLNALSTFCQASGFDKSQLKGSFGLDPIGDFMLTGVLDKLDGQLDDVVEHMEEFNEYRGMKLFEINGKHFHNAGATIVQELGFSMACAVEYLDEMTDRGFDLKVIAEKLKFTLAVSSNYFFELAKFRSVRSLWQRVLESFGLTEPGIQGYFHAETSSWNQTIYDPYVNLLRTTTEAMSAVMGGADSLNILPFNSAYQDPSEVSERLTRNQQILLREEAYLDKVIDPAAGSWYIETLTHEIAQKAWDTFVTVEKDEGIINSFLEGIIQDAIVSVAQERDRRLAFKSDVLLGTNQYPNSLETVSGQVNPKIAYPLISNPELADAQPLIPYRGAESFEQLRLATEKSTKQPVVFLLTIGNLTMRKARASFASNFFGCAGYRVIDNIGFKTIEEGLTKAEQAGADLIVLCSSDDEYAEYGPAAAKSNPKATLVIAGYPAESMELLKAAGIQYFIHMKSNVLETLRGFNALLGIAQKKGS